MNCSTHSVLRACVLAIGVAFAAGPVLADKDKTDDKHEKHGKHGKHDKHDKHDKHGKHGKHGKYHSHGWDNGHHCPPGLAKKHNGCVPPGQAKKYSVGKRLPSDVRYYLVPQPVMVQLPPPPPGHRYVRVGNDVLLLAPQSGIVVNIMLGRLG